MAQNPQIVLASTSKYRTALLTKLAIPFSQIDPDFDEIPVSGESPAEKAKRLARGKAKAGADKLSNYQPAVVIGSDQVAACGSQILSKPGEFSRAKQQLALCSGEWVSFHTAVSLVDQNGSELTSFIDDYKLKFRDLSESTIERYLELDEPYDCAGSIKAESHGILLIEESQGSDINTLYGLPLIRLTTALSEIDLL